MTMRCLTVAYCQKWQHPALDTTGSRRGLRNGVYMGYQGACTTSVPTIPASLCPATVQKYSYSPGVVGVNSIVLLWSVGAATWISISSVTLLMS